MPPHPHVKGLNLVFCWCWMEMLNFINMEKPSGWTFLDIQNVRTFWEAILVFCFRHIHGNCCWGGPWLLWVASGIGYSPIDLWWPYQPRVILVHSFIFSTTTSHQTPGVGASCNGSKLRHFFHQQKKSRKQVPKRCYDGMGLPIISINHQVGSTLRHPFCAHMNLLVLICNSLHQIMVGSGRRQNRQNDFEEGCNTKSKDCHGFALAMVIYFRLVHLVWLGVLQWDGRIFFLNSFASFFSRQMRPLLAK